MTIKEFAEKYDLPAGIVREASFDTRTRKINGPHRKIDYPEDELREATRATAERKLEHVKLLFVNYCGMLSKLTDGGDDQ